MSQQQRLGIGGVAYNSTNDLRTKIYFAVKADTANAGAVVLAGANDRILGFLQNKPNAGEVADVQSVRGSSTKAVAGAAIAKGDALQTDANGKVITGAGAAQKIIGVAMEAASADGDLIEVLLLDGYVA